MGKSMREPPLEQGLPQGREFDLATILDDDVKQGSPITFQLTNQVATDNLDVTTICLFTSQTGLVEIENHQPKLNCYQSVASWVSLVSSPESTLQQFFNLVTQHTPFPRGKGKLYDKTKKRLHKRLLLPQKKEKETTTNKTRKYH